MDRRATSGSVHAFPHRPRVEGCEVRVAIRLGKGVSGDRPQFFAPGEVVGDGGAVLVVIDNVVSLRALRDEIEEALGELLRAKS